MESKPALTANPPLLLEVCVTSSEDAVAAYSAGADRLELTIGIELGGLTPSLALLEQVKRAVAIPVVAMLRPRAAGFRYTSSERCGMMRDAELLLAAGADGIVAGVLREDGAVDLEFWRQLKKLTRDRQLVFHRAIDVVPDPSAVLRQLIDTGTTRVLTSGGRQTAWQGRQQIAQMQRLAAGQIEILAGSGVSPRNAVALIQATGCRQLHGTFADVRHDPAGCVAEARYGVTDPRQVAATRRALDDLSNA
ncbi:MAG: copper homeostasis protein CutC [Novipirellula sp. JB048]